MRIGYGGAMSDSHRIDEIRDEELARISRMVRDSEAGWLFYGPDGTAFHLTTDEAERFEKEGQTILAGYLAKRRGLRLRVVGGAIATAFVGTYALIDLPLVVRIGSGIAALAAASYVARQLLAPALYDRRLRRWRRDVALRLEKSGRGGVPADVEARHRRYNLFHLAEGTLFAALIARLAWNYGPDFAGLQLDRVDIALIAGSILSHVAATRVDATHRRRKWLD